jgi:hypothetical protein
MANYYPLIAKAVAGLEKNTGEARRMLYERARNALVTQLRSVTPALSESDITRERLALEEAIRKVEADAARRARGGTPPARPPKAPEEAPPGKPADAAGPSQTAPSGEAPVPAAEAKPAVPPQEPPREAALAEPKPEPEGWRPPSRPGLRSWLPGRETQPPSRETPAGPPSLSPRFAERGEPPLVSREAAKAAEPPNRPPWPSRPSERVSTERPGAEPETAPRAEPDGPALVRKRGWPPAEDRGEEGAVPPQPPFPPADEEAPEQRGAAALAAIRSLLASRSVMAVAAALVVVLGLSGLVYWQWATIAGLFAGRGTVATPATTPSSRAKITDRIGAPAAPSSRPQEAPSAAQRVVLYEEDPSNPSGKRFVGNAIWRTEQVAAAPGQASDVAVRAEIEIPEAKVTVKWSLRRNTDKALPASHTIEIIFTLPPDFANGGISNIPGILMKQAEQTRGVPLAGLSVKVTTGFFLIGLSNAEADVQRNIQLLKERAWFDVPVVYTNGRRAILAIEKGPPGERAFADAFAAWGE